ncbi:MAG: class IV adenylate cyclase [Bryobacteraceae bacterium]
MPLEIEVKIRLDSAEAGRTLLSEHGYIPSGPREFESNVVFDTPSQGLRSAGQLIRIRRAGTRQILTYKGKSEGGTHKVREELELDVSDADMLAGIFERLGYLPQFRYEKFRTQYGAPAELGHVLLDETPIGDFLELEGPPGWIDQTAERLGFSTKEYLTSSYGALFSGFCRDRGVEGHEMVFDAKAGEEK